MNLKYNIKNKSSELNDKNILHFIEIEFDLNEKENDFNVDFILFKNFYTHLIDIFQFINDEWKVVLTSYKLMNDAECEEDAEKYFIINKKQFINQIKSNRIRIYLFQHSDIWNEFEITNLNFFNEKDINEIKFKEFNSDKIELSNNQYLILNSEEIKTKFLEIENLKIDNFNFKILD